jgi:anti-anti-sigma factor
MSPVEKKETLKIVPQVSEGEILILRVIGFIDASNINLFVRQMREQLGRGYRRIILDFSELQYMDINSSAQNIFLNLHQLATARQASVRILNLPWKLEQLFRKLGLNKHFQIFTEEKKAIQSF